MLKAFDNFEIWFVTGAQLLYGATSQQRDLLYAQQGIEIMFNG